MRTNQKTYTAARSSLPTTVFTGRQLENFVSKILNHQSIFYEDEKNLQYDDYHRSASIREDFILPNTGNPKTTIYVTHSNPSKARGHSNENKLHQALGELYLLKTYYPELRCVAFLGGLREKWTEYVPQAISFFYDGVSYAWDNDPAESFLQALDAPLKHSKFWEEETQLRKSIELSTDPQIAPNSFLRTNFYKQVIPKYLGITSPAAIYNEPLKFMAQSAIDKNGAFWQHLYSGDFPKIWSERTYFNPLEACVALLLNKEQFAYKGGLGEDVDVHHNLLLEMGYSSANRKTDFLLEDAEGVPVYIQCKSAGGGQEGQLTKHITDRAREQIARSMIYRSTYRNGKLISQPKNFRWYFVLDNKWRTPNHYPLKYLHILEIAGVDQVFPSDDLITDNFEVNPNSELAKELSRIGCKRLSH